MKGRGRTARLAAAASPRTSAAATLGSDATGTDATGTDATGAEGSSTAVAAARLNAGPLPATAGVEAREVNAVAARGPAPVLERAEGELPMDQSEYTDEVDNEFVRGRMQNVVRVATGEEVEITFGDGFHSDMAGTVQLDPNDPSKDAPAEDRIVMMQGGLEHEICHELYYDRGAFEALKQQVEAYPDRRPVAFLNNVLADGHDEWRHKLRRPEAYELIEAHDALFVETNGSGRWSFDPDKQDTWTQVTGAMLYRGLPYYTVPEDRLSPKAKKIYAEVSPKVDEAVSGTSWDCLAKANEIFDILQKHNAVPKRPEQNHLAGGAGPGTPKGGAPQAPGLGGSAEEPAEDSGTGHSPGSWPGSAGEGTDEQGGPGSAGGSAGTAGSEGDTPLTYEEKAQVTGSGGGEPGEPTGGESGGSGTGSGEGSETGSGTGPGEGSGGGPGQGTGAGSAFAAEGAAGERALESQRGAAKTLADGAKSRRPQDSYRKDPAERVLREPGHYEEFRRRWQGNRRQAREFAGQIEEARTETMAPKTRQTTGRLDRSRRRALAAGDPRVFTKRGRSRELDMSVELLLDVSGSMNREIPALKDSTSIISRGLDEAGIDHEVRGFASQGENPLYRAFGEKADWKLGSMQAMGGTDLDEGMSRVRGAFRGRSEKQKLAIVFTDGSPHDVDAAKAELAAARRDGVSVLGVFLRSPADPGKYDDYPEELRQKFQEKDRAKRTEVEQRMRELFGGKVSFLDDVGQLPKVTGKKIVDLLRREER